MRAVYVVVVVVVDVMLVLVLVLSAICPASGSLVVCTMGEGPRGGERGTNAAFIVAVCVCVYLCLCFCFLLFFKTGRQTCGEFFVFLLRFSYEYQCVRLFTTVKYVVARGVINSSCS